MTQSQHLVLTVLVVDSILLGCKPEVGQAPSLITDYALLAVKGEPAEAKPDENVVYSFLLASPSGTVTDATAGWDVCETPKSPAENSSVASACNPSEPGPTTGQTFEAPVLTNACMLFGPIAPPVKVGQPAIRPRDPDSTGGYYLPVRVKFPDLATGSLTGFAFERISCDLANAATDIVAEYDKQYQPNNDPGIAATDVIRADGSSFNLDASTDANPQTITSGESVVFQATFADGSAETFPVLNSSGDALVDQTESLYMSWFATSGSFQHDRTGVAGSETATSTSNTWKAPDTAIPVVYLWLVLRDSRGGTTFKSYGIQVTQ
jgi:hypothetical protein